MRFRDEMWVEKIFWVKKKNKKITLVYFASHTHTHTRLNFFNEDKKKERMDSKQKRFPSF